MRTCARKHTPKPGSSNRWPWSVYFEEKQQLPLFHHILQKHLSTYSHNQMDLFISFRSHFILDLPAESPHTVRTAGLNALHDSIYFHKQFVLCHFRDCRSCWVAESCYFTVTFPAVSLSARMSFSFSVSIENVLVTFAFHLFSSYHYIMALSSFNFSRMFFPFTFGLFIWWSFLFFISPFLNLSFFIYLPYLISSSHWISIEIELGNCPPVGNWSDANCVWHSWISHWIIFKLSPP